MQIYYLVLKSSYYSRKFICIVFIFKLQEVRRGLYKLKIIKTLSYWVKYNILLKEFLVFIKVGIIRLFILRRYLIFIFYYLCFQYKSGKFLYLF
jgi:hypothetical protein